MYSYHWLPELSSTFLLRDVPYSSMIEPLPLFPLWSFGVSLGDVGGVFIISALLNGLFCHNRHAWNAVPRAASQSWFLTGWISVNKDQVSTKRNCIFEHLTTPFMHGSKPPPLYMSALKRGNIFLPVQPPIEETQVSDAVIVRYIYMYIVCTYPQPFQFPAGT